MGNKTNEPRELFINGHLCIATYDDMTEKWLGVITFEDLHIDFGDFDSSESCLSFLKHIAERIVSVDEDSELLEAKATYLYRRNPHLIPPLDNRVAECNDDCDSCKCEEDCERCCDASERNTAREKPDYQEPKDRLLFFRDRMTAFKETMDHAIGFIERTAELIPSKDKK